MSRHKVLAFLRSALGRGSSTATSRAGWSATPSTIGYRHIDTAQMYGNEAEVGAAIASSAVPREQIWLTTKIWPDNFRAGALQRAAEESVRRLGTEPDLLLLHWPNPSVPLEETMRRAERGQAARPRPAHRDQQFHGRADPRRARAQRGAAGGQPGRVPPVSRARRRCSRSCAPTAWRSPPTRRSPRAGCSMTRRSRASASATARPPAR